MDIIEVIKKRRSIREYQERPIAKKDLEALVDAARFAPTARGVEPWEFIVITEAATLKKIGEMAENGRFLLKAKACIAVFCSDTKYYLEDGCTATQNILLAATALGIGSCWVAGDKKPYCGEISRLLNTPENYRLISLISLGFPKDAGSFRISDKKKLEEIMHWERF
jgi:nitroreductase